MSHGTTEAAGPGEAAAKARGTEPSVSGWDRRRTETAARVLDAAERLASEEGVEALTMQRLGAELGYRAGALYRYFPSKDALIAALLVRILRDVGVMMRAASTDAEGLALRARRPMSAEARLLLPLVLSARGYLLLADERPAQIALLVRALAAPRPVVDDAAAQALATATLALLREASTAFRAAREGGALAPGDDLPRVALLWASLHGIVGNRKLARFDVPGLTPPALVSELVRTLLVGWGAPREDVEDCIDRAARAAARER
jgi:AcrR family transcriptional regulator